MNSYKRVFFVSALAVVTLINLYTDVNVYRQADTELRSDEQVELSHNRIHEMDRVRVTLLKNELSHRDDEKLQIAVDSLRQTLGKEEFQSRIVGKYQGAQFDLKSSLLRKQILSQLDNLIEHESAVLKADVASDKISDQGSTRSILLANFIDVLLIILMFSYAYLEISSARINQAKLKASMAQIQVLNSELQGKVEKEGKNLHDTVSDVRKPVESIMKLAALMKRGSVDAASVAQMFEHIHFVSSLSLSMMESALERDKERRSEPRPEKTAS